MFNSETTAYALELAPGSTSVVLYGTASDFYATVSGDGSVSAPTAATIRVTADDGTIMEYSVNITIDPGVSVFDLNDEKGPGLFYNSVSDIVRFRNSIDVEMLEIFSITGRLLIAARSNNQESFEISTESIPKGVYIVRMKLASYKLYGTKFVK